MQTFRKVVLLSKLLTMVECLKSFPALAAAVCCHRQIIVMLRKALGCREHSWHSVGFGAQNIPATNFQHLVQKVPAAEIFWAKILGCQSFKKSSSLNFCHRIQLLMCRHLKLHNLGRTVRFPTVKQHLLVLDNVTNM